MRKNIFMICVTLLTVISISGCGSKYEQTEEMLNSILADDQQVVMLVDDVEETTTIPEITTQEITTEEMVTTQEIITEEMTTKPIMMMGRPTTTAQQETTMPETTTQEITTEEMTMPETTTQEAITQQETIMPETTTQEITTEEATTAAAEEVIDFTEAKEAFKKYFAENSSDYNENNYNCWAGYINDTVYVLFKLHLYAYRDGAVIDMNFGHFDKYTDKYIFSAYGCGAEVYNRKITDVYALGDEVSYLCSYVHIYYINNEVITKESYHKINTEDHFYTGKDYNDMENDPESFVTKEEYDSVHENIKTVIYSSTIDEAFVAMEEINK